MAAIADGCDQETGWTRKQSVPAGFLSAPGRSRGGEIAARFLLFDNEIDWVTCWEVPRSAARRMEEKVGSNAFEYKAEHMARVIGKLITRASVQKEECL